jgi:oxaloacetate decarboxylase (Na+ extruding) subunit alpha
VDSIKFIDTTLRDGQLSLWALGMRTGMMLPALRHMDEAGFEGMEFFVPSVQIQKMIKELHEDPWKWLRLGSGRIRKTRLRMTGGYRSALTKFPTAAGKLLVKTVIGYGVTITRISDPWNDFDDLRQEVEDLRDMGMDSVVNLIYTVSPRHTDDYYVKRAEGAAALAPHRICFKDVGGLLTPDRIRDLLPKIIKAVGNVPLEFHGHCNNGFGPVNVLEAVKAGVRFVHCAVPPLANGSSNPSIFTTVRNLRALGYNCEIDERVLRPVEDYFTSIARHENLPIGAPTEYDHSLYVHQIPGGMISNLRHQLKRIGMDHRLQETLEEAGRVRAEFGYPIMVTPLSQFVGSQAAINVMTGERYKQVTDEVIHYALGNWGREAVKVMDLGVRSTILNRARATELANWTEPQPSLADLRHKYGENLTDEQLLLRVYGGENAVEIASAQGEPTEYVPEVRALIDLLSQLTRCDKRRTISLSNKNFSLTLERNANG